MFRPKQTLKVHINYIKKCPKWTPFLLHCFCLPTCTFVLMGSSLVSADTGKEDSGLIYRRFYTMCRHCPKVNRYDITVSLQ